MKVERLYSICYENRGKMVTRLGIEPRTYGLRVLRHLFCKGFGVSWSGCPEGILMLRFHFLGPGVAWAGVGWYLIWLANGWQVLRV